MYHIFYHVADLDGRCGGAIVAYWCEVHGHAYRLWPFNYGWEFPWEAIAPGDAVVLVDISLPPYLMRALAAGESSLVWLDHHATAIAATDDRGMDGLRDVARAGCELAWAWCFPSRPAPWLVEIIGRYDVWDQADRLLWEGIIHPVQYGLQRTPTDPALGMEPWRARFTLPFREEAILVADLARAGEMVLDYLTQTWAEYLAAYGYVVELCGMRALCCNLGRTSAVAFDSAFRHGAHDLMVAYVHNGTTWKVSLYSSKPGVHCGEIARRYGGGGHAGAAGFTCAALPWAESPGGFL